MPKIAMRESPGNHLFEQPHLLPAHLRDIKEYSRQIAARPRKNPTYPIATGSLSKS